VPQQVLEQFEFAPRQVELNPASRDATAQQVHLQIVRTQHNLAPGEVAPKQRAQPGDELGKDERLDQIIIGPAVETFHTILDGVTRCQDHDRAREAFGSQALQYLEPIPQWEHSVEDDGIDLRRRREPVPLLAVARDQHLVPFLSQAALKAMQKLRLILNDQEPRHERCLLIAIVATAAVSSPAKFIKKG
jgi:hypothetical protein